MIRRKRLQNVFSWLWLLTGGLASLVAAFLILAEAPQLEVPLLIAATTIGTIGMAIAWIWKRLRRFRTMLLVVFMPCFFLSIGLAIVHGWGVAVEIIYILVSLAFVIAVFAFIWRFHRRAFPQVPDELYEQAKHDGFIPLRDDGQEIVVYTDKVLVFSRLLLAIVVAAVCIACQVFLSISIVFQIACSLFDLLIGLAILLLIVRLVKRKPALIINAEGIRDNASLIATGAGLISWNEIASVRIMGKPSSSTFFSTRNVVIVPISARQVLKRQRFVKRFLIRLLSWPMPYRIRISESLLPMRADVLVDDIDRYLAVRTTSFHRHAQAARKG